MDTVLKNIVSRKMPLKFSINNDAGHSNNHNFVNFKSSHVRLQRFISETMSFRNMQKKIDFLQKFTLVYPLKYI